MLVFLGACALAAALGFGLAVLTLRLRGGSHDVLSRIRVLRHLPWLQKTRPVRAEIRAGDSPVETALTRTVARELLTPRTDIVAVEADDDLQDMLRAAAESGFSRLPVVGESLDEILGIVVVKDLIRETLGSQSAEVVARDVMRPAVFVPETKLVNDLLSEMQAQKMHLVVVVDEFGGTGGIVTLEDLLEEIVGEIYDEHDPAETGVQVGPDGSVTVDGSSSFEDLVEALEIPAPPDEEEDYDTIAGYVIHALGHIPELGEGVQIDVFRLEVGELVDRRVTRVRLLGLDDSDIRRVSQMLGP